MNKLILGIVIGLIIGVAIGATGFYAIYNPKVTTTTVTITVSPSEVPYTTPGKIKAAFIYVGPIGDFGWSHAHEVGRQVALKLFSDWLESVPRESISKEATASVIDELIRAGYNVIFTTSFDHMDPTYEKALQYPNVMFFHCSGYKRAPNMGTYFADLYQVYYLNGLIAGAVTHTGKLGYVAAHTIPEVVRHINAFAIGAMEMGKLLNKNIEVYVIEIGAWYDPDKAREAARTLVERYNVDVLAFTEDSTAIVEYAQSLFKEKEKLVYVFSHYSPMYVYGPDVVISGQLVRWEVIYVDILAKIKAGVYRPDNLENVDYWYLLNSGAVELGAHIYEDGSVMMINPKFEPLLKEVKVKDPAKGVEVSVYDYVMKRYEQMKNAPILQSLQGTAPTHEYESMKYVEIDVKAIPKHIIAPTFDPFEGPLRGYCIRGGTDAFSSFCIGRPVNAEVTIGVGIRLKHEDLWNMDWFVEGIKYMGKM
ncbi:MAG: BMP family ABC transporter substrate-binding protein [Ignisphaera sp.]